MYKLILFFTSCSILFACSAIESGSSSMRGPYVSDFKMIYFKKLILEANSNSQAIRKVVAFDNSGYGETLLSLDDFQLIDGLVKADNQQLVKDSIDKIGQVSEGAQGKDIFNYAINKYQSKWLHRIAKERYKLYRSKNKKYKKWLDNAGRG